MTLDGRLVGLVSDQGDDHAVQVEEEQDEMEAELRKRFLLRHKSVSSGPNMVSNSASSYLFVHVQLSEDLGRI